MKYNFFGCGLEVLQSPSARRVLVEIACPYKIGLGQWVTLREEGVG